MGQKRDSPSMLKRELLSLRRTLRTDLQLTSPGASLSSVSDKHQSDANTSLSASSLSDVWLAQASHWRGLCSGPRGISVSSGLKTERH